MTRVWVSDVLTVRPTAAPKAPPTSINGPSRPIDSPPAIATHEDATRDAVARSDNCTPPSAMASITLLTPWAPTPETRDAPATAAAATGTVRRSHPGKLAIESTMLSAP